ASATVSRTRCVLPATSPTKKFSCASASRSVGVDILLGLENWRSEAGLFPSRTRGEREGRVTNPVCLPDPLEDRFARGSDLSSLSPRSGAAHFLRLASLPRSAGEAW